MGVHRKGDDTDVIVDDTGDVAAFARDENAEVGVESEFESFDMLLAGRRAHRTQAAGGPASSRQIIAHNDANSRAVVVGPSRVCGSDRSSVRISVNRPSIDR
jgi:hypothetical protein